MDSSDNRIDLKLEEHVVDKETQYGTVRRSLNQHKVYLLNDENGKYTHCGFVGVTHFLPLSGFPPELLEDVTRECSRQLGREVLSGKPPLSRAALEEAIRNAQPEVEDDDFDDE